ncbi:hypothetical protein [Acanthopleuribacter pedis]|uniref:DUF3311 domain-containing protein n=1 Tax=Acanthopleuribacter pedis TaxID=442870 RepID=A0A8J7QJ50_9BACT|nr:hypothetical protein [Acanthopleuribacter pedis]MBO1319180.1 hypothetical protein [Acanthopleuribacter pedis]
MSTPARQRGLLFVIALVALFIVRVDVWQWDDPGRLLGLPIGLTYHVAFCFLLIAFFYAMVRWAWPYDDKTGGDA